jgi:cobalamin-dependent methionine synthase I
MAGVHICIGLSNCSDGLPRRLAINRAYLRVAMEYGLDAAILDVTKVTGKDLVDGEILRLVRRIVKAEPEEMLDILVDFVQATKQKKG